MKWHTASLVLRHLRIIPAKPIVVQHVHVSKGVLKGMVVERRHQRGVLLPVSIPGLLLRNLCNRRRFKIHCWACS